MLEFDHIAVVAPSLEAGKTFVRERLGVDVPDGGAHPLMGTHNCLMKLGQDEFFEIIAIDPDAPDPGRSRWFGLDNLGDGPIRVGNWICRTEDVDRAIDTVEAETGPAIAMTRGDLNWRITVPEDGSLPYGGGVPTLLEWPERPFPGSRMPDLGCALERLTIRHPEAARIEAMLEGKLTDPRIVFETGETVALKAAIRTPDGVREI
ncbi:VOC family protein [Aestuariibius insulae]|uniref:VOC family protein n=1 Tax=Aestuariibius insulae TaxID=2058287 RepID=UPI00345E0A62